MFILVIQRLLLEALLDIFYFPIWWYSGGLKTAGGWCWDLLKSGNEGLAPSLWLENIFVPMYGQYDWQGRIISFLMRLVQVIARTIALFFWAIICLALFLIWLALPVVVIFGLFNFKTKI